MTDYDEYTTYATGDAWDYNSEMAALFADRVARGPLSERPSASNAPDNAVYLATDENVVYRNDPTNGWDDIDKTKADLTASDGVLVSSQVPPLSITETYTVADETERLALDVQEGDVAIQQDNETTYIFTGGDPSSNSNWSEIQFDVVAGIAGEVIDPAGITNQDYSESVVTHGSASGTVTLDLASANVHRIEATGDVTVAFSNVTTSPPGNSLTVYVTDGDGSGPHALSWPSSVVWDGGNTVGQVDASSNVEISLLTDDGGTEWRGRLSGEAFA